MNLSEYLPKEINTYKEFNAFLFLKFGKNKEKFRKFNSFPDTFKFTLLIEFLETKKGVPFLTAMIYYNCRHNGTPSFSELTKYTIIWEFHRIEKKITTNYIPF